MSIFGKRCLGLLLTAVTLLALGAPALAAEPTEVELTLFRFQADEDIWIYEPDRTTDRERDCEAVVTFRNEEGEKGGDKIRIEAVNRTYISHLQTMHSLETGGVETETVNLGGIDMLYYRQYSDQRYYYRDPGNGLTLQVIVSDKEDTEADTDQIQAVLDSIVFTLPEPDGSYTEPPAIEDGEPVADYAETRTSQAGELTITAEPLKAGEPMVTFTEFEQFSGPLGDGTFLQTDRETVRRLSLEGDVLTELESWPVQDFGDFDRIETDENGLVYTSGFVAPRICRDGSLEQLWKNGSGNFAVSPDGTWAVSYSMTRDIMRHNITPEGLDEGETWFLTDLSDEENHAGPFQRVDWIFIHGDRIYVGGYVYFEEEDKKNGGAAIYDLEGNELALLGAADMFDDGFIGTATDVAVTDDGYILILNWVFSDIIVFDADGNYIGTANTEELVGTTRDYMMDLSQDSQGNVYMTGAVERRDGSALESVIYRLTVE